MNKITLFLKNKNKEVDFLFHLKNLIRIIEQATEGVVNHYKKNKIQYVEVPEIVGITGACENVDTLFKINNRLNLPLFFTQTGQLALEQSLQVIHAAYTIIHSGRDEEEEDSRHLRQFRLTEEEFDSSLVGMERDNYDEEKMYQALLSHIEKAAKAMIFSVLENESESLSYYRQDIDLLKKIFRKKSFLRITYEEAISLLNKNKVTIKFGDDLKAEHEAKIVEVLNKKEGFDYPIIPVFIMRYPKEIKFFNMKVSQKDPRVVLSADLIFPKSGEAVGAAVREHDFDRLNERLINSTMYKLHLKRGGSYQDFKWYLDIIKNKRTLPHAGYGLGNERLYQYLLNQKDIRVVSPFYLLGLQTKDYHPKRLGKIVFYSHKKTILLSIGKLKNKRELLPYIKKAASEDLIFYATEKTHRFLKKNGIKSTLVYKISQVGKSPNIARLLEDKIFDLIINIPTGRRKFQEITDGKLIREGAIETGVTLITDIEVAKMVFDKLTKKL